MSKEWQPPATPPEYFTPIEFTPKEMWMLNDFSERFDSKQIAAKLDEFASTAAFGNFPIFHINAFLYKIVKNGEVWIERDYGDWCPICHDHQTYKLHTRDSKTHRRGDKDLNHPIRLSGWQLKSGFVNWKNKIDYCANCDKHYHITESILRVIKERDLPVELKYSQAKDTRWVKDDGRRCYKCHAEIWESEMGRSPCMMGGGTYPNKCPKCGAEGLPLFGSFCNHFHEVLHKFRLIRPPGFQEGK